MHKSGDAPIEPASTFSTRHEIRSVHRLKFFSVRQSVKCPQTVLCYFCGLFPCEILAEQISISLFAGRSINASLGIGRASYFRSHSSKFFETSFPQALSLKIEPRRYPPTLKSVVQNTALLSESNPVNPNRCSGLRAHSPWTVSRRASGRLPLFRNAGIISV